MLFTIFLLVALQVVNISFGMFYTCKHVKGKNIDQAELLTAHTAFYRI